MDIKRIKELAGMPKGPKAAKKVITSITGEIGGIRLSEEVDFKHLARTHGADVSIKDIKGVCIGVVTFNEGSAEESKEKLAAFRAAWKQLLSGETPIDSINEAKQRKTSDEYTIQGYYSGSWEDVTTEETSKGAKDRIKEYRANEAGVSFRMIKRRVKNESVENVNEAKNDVLYVLYVGEKGSGKLSQQFSDESSAACHQEYKDSWCNDHDSDGKKIKYSHKVVKQSPGETLPMKIDESFKLNEGLVYGECMECNEPTSVRAVKDSSNNYIPDPLWKCENCGAVDAFNEEHPYDREDREDMYEGACPLKGHAYHDKSDAELEYICKDASEAAKNMKGMNDTAEAKYLDQANDASTILHYRKKKPVKEDSNNFFLNHSSTKPVAVMGLQEPNDLNNRMGIDTMRSEKVEVPSDVKSAVNSRIAELKKSIAEYDNKGYNDISQKEKCIECLEKTMEHLSKGDVEGLKQAQIYFATLMSPITEFFPAKLITFLGNADARKAGWLDRFKVTEGVGYSERRGIVRNRDARNDMNTELGAVGADDSDSAMFPAEPEDDYHPSDWQSSHEGCYDDGDDGDTPPGFFYEKTVQCPVCQLDNAITPAHLKYMRNPMCLDCEVSSQRSGNHFDDA